MPPSPATPTPLESLWPHRPRPSTPLPSPRMPWPVGSAESRLSTQNIVASVVLRSPVAKVPVAVPFLR